MSLIVPTHTKLVYRIYAKNLVILAGCRCLQVADCNKITWTKHYSCYSLNYYEEYFELGIFEVEIFHPKKIDSQSEVYQSCYWNAEDLD